MSKTSRTFYLEKDGPKPESSGKSSRYTPELIFLAAIASPRLDDNGECVFDAKIGFWIFIEMVATKRNFRNKPALALEPKSVSVNRDVYRKFITEKVIPAIKRKWPGRKSDLMRCNKITPHVMDVAEERQRFRWNIKMTNQPANSPDFNVLDLGFFRDVRFLQYEHGSRTVQELINAYNAEFDAYEPRNIDSNVTCLQKCMECSPLKQGRNRYKQPHAEKFKHRNNGDSMANIVCVSAIYNLAQNIANERR